jgi:hypothetical protein
MLYVLWFLAGNADAGGRHITPIRNLDGTDGD